MEFQFIEDYCSAVFNDLSMLFAELNADGDSYVCLKPDYTSDGKFQMNITGGTGRFEGASGYFNCDIVSHSHYLGGPLGAQSGKFKGMITFED